MVFKWKMLLNITIEERLLIRQKVSNSVKLEAVEQQLVRYLY